MLALAYVLVLAIVSLQVPLALSLRDRVSSDIRSQARSQAEILGSSATDLLAPSARRRLGSLVSATARSIRGRVIVVDRRGRLIADSAGSADAGADYSGRPEVAAALAGRRQQEQRYSRSLAQELLATAVPVLRQGAPAGAVRITQSVAAVNRALSRVTLQIALLGLLVLVLGLGAGALIARSVARPILRLQEAARRVAGGDLGARVTPEGSAEQRSLADSFNEMTERLERLLGAQRDFVADASHQLRTPLTAVRLRIEEARAGGLDPEADGHLAAGAAEVDRMAHMVGELLLLGRAGERHLPGERLELADVLRRAAERWSPAAVSAGVALTLERPAAPAFAWCARADIDRAIDALLENAIAYGARGGEVALAAGAGWIEVRDRGPGVTPGEEVSVWERFHRGAAGRRGPAGTGLGLPIARELAAEWGGRATLENRPGGGAVARLDFPTTPGLSPPFAERLHNPGPAPTTLAEP